MDSFVRGGYIFDVVDGGDPAGEAVVLLHGFPQDQTAWSQVAPLLQEAGCRTLALGMRGASRGARPKEVGQYRTAEHVNDVLGLLDAAGLQQAHIVGHDWGGYVAWALACEHPERVRSLTAVSTPHPAAIKRAIEALAHGTDEFAARRMDRSIRAALSGRRVDDVANAGVAVK
jgi:pimeloyl-ACP methyl ester carboxylesterase